MSFIFQTATAEEIHVGLNRAIEVFNDLSFI